MDSRPKSIRRVRACIDIINIGTGDHSFGIYLVIKKGSCVRLKRVFFISCLFLFGFSSLNHFMVVVLRSVCLFEVEEGTICARYKEVGSKVT